MGRPVTEWRDIPGLPGYRVSDKGDVSRNGVIIKRKPTKHYPVVTVAGKQTRISRLVLLAFTGPAPAERPFALHWNDICTDNHLTNLRWGSREENTEDCKRNRRRIVKAAERRNTINDRRSRPNGTLWIVVETGTTTRRTKVTIEDLL